MHLEFDKMLGINGRRVQSSEFHPSPTDSELYRIQDAFADLDKYWIDQEDGFDEASLVAAPLAGK